MIKIRHGGDPPKTPGAPHDQQAGVARLELQHAADALVRDHGANRVLGTLQRRRLHEVFVRGRARKIIRQVARYYRRINVAVLDLQRHGTLEVNEEGMVELRSGAYPTALRQLARGADGAMKNDLGEVLMPA